MEHIVFLIYQSVWWESIENIFNRPLFCELYRALICCHSRDIYILVHAIFFFNQKKKNRETQLYHRARLPRRPFRLHCCCDMSAERVNVRRSAVIDRIYLLKTKTGIYLL